MNLTGSASSSLFRPRHRARCCGIILPLKRNTASFVSMVIIMQVSGERGGSQTTHHYPIKLPFMKKALRPNGLKTLLSIRYSPTDSAAAVIGSVVGKTRSGRTAGADRHVFFRSPGTIRLFIQKTLEVRSHAGPFSVELSKVSVKSSCI